MISFSTILDFIDSLPAVIVFFVACAFLYPMGRFLFPKIKNINVAASIHLTFGLLLSLLLFKSDTFWIVLMAITTYIGVRFCPVWLSCFIASIGLFASHAVVMLRPINWALDMTGITMVMFQKAVSLTFNVSDGKKKKKGEKLVRARWEALSVEECPSFFIYLAYVFTPYGSFSNPFLEFKPFTVMLNRGNRKDEEIPPEDHKFALQRYIGAFLWAIFIQLSMTFISLETTYKAQWYINLPAILKIIVIPTLTIVQASRYFPAWWMVDSGFYELGLGHSGIPTLEFEDVSNLSMLKTLQSPTCDEWMRRWNHTTHLFWKNYLLTRMLNHGVNKVICNVAVFVASMAWHGLRFVYLGLLPEAFLFMAVDSYWNRKFPQKDASKFMKVCHNLWVIMTMMYSTSTWYYPQFETFVYLRCSVYFLPDIIAIGIYIMCLIIPKKKTSDKKE